MRNIAVVGGGWAGCAAAVELCRKGDVAVTLFEAARTLGGRARQVEMQDMALDNGQHILLGAYGESLRLMREVGITPETALLRLPMQMRYAPCGDGMDFVSWRLPAPLHMLGGLLSARGLRAGDKLALARFTSAARWMDWRQDTDCSVTELLDRFDQTDRLVQLMWRPLCIAALNTPPERASAQVFLNVLRDSLGASRRGASDMLIPRRDLTALFPSAAASYVERHGGVVRSGTAVSGLRRVDDGWKVVSGEAEHSFEGVVLATGPHHAAGLLEGWVDVAALQSMRFEPITTCYLRYEDGVSLGHPFFALRDDPVGGEWGQFVFDRGMLDARQRGLLAVVVSASTEAIADGHEALAAALAAQLARAFGQPGLSAPLWSKVISEKRATFSCTPGMHRMGNATGLPGLVIAGDHTACDYPATLEGAVRSGVQAAALLLA
ncbi:MAG TPA: hydroxysqualene dehydroxylase HpnE [Noviherbaspirillum sp.]|jgi:squalene-associated FAD-dependent desaturase|uniref:hydroxysqualene dehydroxylase HpnE n=1 Tax=Noviherbaspirillum sp. TaxID=1926288 RepID=UPI002F92340A